jgi:hypothetical protein
MLWRTVEVAAKILHQENAATWIKRQGRFTAIDRYSSCLEMAEMDIGNITVERTFDVARMSAAYFEADDIGAVIRCHYEAEEALTHVASRLSDGRSDRRISKWNFAQKLDLCHILGVHENFLKPLTTHNKQRNEFAHQGTSTLREQQVLDVYHQVRVLYPVLGDDFRVAFNGAQKSDKRYADATLKEKYVTCLMVAVSLLMALPCIAEATSQRA